MQRWCVLLKDADEIGGFEEQMDPSQNMDGKLQRAPDKGNKEDLMYSLRPPYLDIHLAKWIQQKSKSDL